MENKQTLTDAIAEYARLEAEAQAVADTAAADAVEEKIAAIGEVTCTAESKAKIDEAQAAYDALTDAQKALVENADVLTAAQEQYAALKAAAQPDTPAEPTDANACPLCGRDHTDDTRTMAFHTMAFILKTIVEMIMALFK